MSENNYIIIQRDDIENVREVNKKKKQSSFMKRDVKRTREKEEKNFFHRGREV